MQPQNLSSLNQAIYRKLIEPQKLNYPQGGMGTVIVFDYITKLADVRMADPITGFIVDYHSVHVHDTDRGIVSTAIRPGDHVWVEFKTATSPIITSVFTNRNTKQHMYLFSGPQVPRMLHRSI